MDNLHHIASGLVGFGTALVLIIFFVYAYKTFTYVDRQHADYWQQRRGPFLPSIDLLYNSYMLLGFLLRRDYKALGDSALDKLADNARLFLIVSLILCILRVIRF